MKNMKERFYFGLKDCGRTFAIIIFLIAVLVAPIFLIDALRSTF